MFPFDAISWFFFFFSFDHHKKRKKIKYKTKLFCTEMDRPEKNGLGLTKTGVVAAVVVVGCAVVLAAGGAYLLRRRWARDRDEAGAPALSNPVDMSREADARLAHVRWGDMLLGVAIGALYCVFVLGANWQNSSCNATPQATAWARD